MDGNVHTDMKETPYVVMQIQTHWQNTDVIL